VVGMMVLGQLWICLGFADCSQFLRGWDLVVVGGSVLVCLGFGGFPGCNCLVGG